MKIDQHAWNRGGVWDAYFAVVLAATLLIVLTAQGSLATRAARQRDPGRGTRRDRARALGRRPPGHPRPAPAA
jgi:hypothetical protein